VRNLELDLERLPAEQVLAHVIDRNERVAIACSFQKEASVIMHMATEITSDVSFFTLDTGLHFQETYDTWRALEERYEVTVEGLRGDKNLWRCDAFGPFRVQFPRFETTRTGLAPGWAREFDLYVTAGAHVQ